jgi:hypothetical protein
LRGRDLSPQPLGPGKPISSRAPVDNDLEAVLKRPTPNAALPADSAAGTMIVNGVNQGTDENIELGRVGLSPPFAHPDYTERGRGKRRLENRSGKEWPGLGWTSHFTNDFTLTPVHVK